MRYTLLLVAFLFACGGKNSNSPSGSEDQTNSDRSLPDGGTDGRVDGGLDGGIDGGIDGGTDGGLGGGLHGYTATLTNSRRPQDGGQVSGEDVAFICCISPTNQNCQLPRGEADFSPARRITVLQGGYALISAEIYSDADCHTLDRTLTDVLLYFPDPPDDWAVQLEFTPPLPVGMQMSVKWTAGGCEPPCANYTVGSTPGYCWAE